MLRCVLFLSSWETKTYVEHGQMLIVCCRDMAIVSCTFLPSKAVILHLASYEQPLEQCLRTWIAARKSAETCTKQMATVNPYSRNSQV